MENYRQYFRIALFHVPVVLQTSDGDYHGTIRDMSGNGMSFYLYERIEFERCMLEFTLQEQSYLLAAEKIRKEKTAQGDYVYACTFVHVPEKVQSSIVSTLLRLDAIRRKK